MRPVWPFLVICVIAQRFAPPATREELLDPALRGHKGTRVAGRPHTMGCAQYVHVYSAGKGGLHPGFRMHCVVCRIGQRGGCCEGVRILGGGIIFACRSTEATALIGFQLALFVLWILMSTNVNFMFTGRGLLENSHLICSVTNAELVSQPIPLYFLRLEGK